MSLRLSLCALLLTIPCAAAQAAGVCTLSAGALVFPAYVPVSNRSAMSTDRASDTPLVLTCTGIVRGGPYSLRLSSAGASEGTTQFLRHAAGDTPMRVLLYQDAGRTVPWTRAAAITGVLPPGDSRHTHVVFGRIPALQSQLRPGAYRASLAATLDYTP